MKLLDKLLKILRRKEPAERPKHQPMSFSVWIEGDYFVYTYRNALTPDATIAREAVMKVHKQHDHRFAPSKGIRSIRNRDLADFISVDGKIQKQRF